jgi:hypothetical protein
MVRDSSRCWREGQQLAGEPGAALHRLAGVGDPALNLFTILRCQGDQFEVAGDRLQEVVEVVGDPAGELADCLDLLGLDQRCFGPLALGDFRAQLFQHRVAFGQRQRQLVVLALEHGRRRDGQQPRQQRPEQDGGRHGRRGSDRLDRRLRAIVAVPQVPDTHHMGQPAREDEQGEQPEHLAEVHVRPLADEADQRDRDGEVSGGNQRVGDDVGPDQLRPPQQAVAVGRVVAAEKVAQIVEHDGSVKVCSSPA